MYKTLFGFLAVLFISCGDGPILEEFYYRFGDVVIKRTDQRSRTTLYYMQDGVPIDTVWTTYSGLTNSWFKADLFFLSDKSVLLLRGGVGTKEK